MKQAKEIKKKIRTIKSIEHITRAMKMVAAAKLKKAQKRLDAIGPYSDGVAQLTQDLLPYLRQLRHAFTEKREAVRNRLVVVVTSDKGLCGSYNTTVLRKFESLMLQNRWNKAHTRILAIGKKAGDYFAKRGFELAGRHLNGDASPSFGSVEGVMRSALDAFTSGAVDEVAILSTRFISTIRYQVEFERLLPLSFEEPAAQGFNLPAPAGVPRAEYLFEPDRGAIVDFLLPRIVMVKFYRALIEAITSEHAARMTSMGNATDKSNEIIESLTLMLNKARQATVTLEILDIVGGAEALKNK